MRTIVVSQPTYLPWLGYFRIMKEADVFVFLDSVQFERRSWQCRNRIKSVKKWIWQTVPTHSKHGTFIKDVEIDNTKPWQRQHWNALRTCYGKAPYFDLYAPFFRSVYEAKWTKLASLNIYIIKYLLSQLGLSPSFLKSSDLKAKGAKTSLLLDICTMLDADRYVSTIGSKEYMQKDEAEKLFKDRGITLEFFEYKHPVYPQLFGDFVPYLSVVDCLFNCGPKSAEIIFGEEP